MMSAARRRVGRGRVGPLRCVSSFAVLQDMLCSFLDTLLQYSELQMIKWLMIIR